MIKSDINLKHTMECGQVFRFRRIGDGYLCISADKAAYVYKKGECVCIDGDVPYFSRYLDLHNEELYKNAAAYLSHDPIMERAIEYCNGLHILNQNKWETLISFIISACNNIPRITKIVESLCLNFGDRIDGDLYAFPTPEQIAELTLPDLDVIKAGFRAKYILEAARRTVHNNIDLESYSEIDTPTLRKLLTQYHGIGEKVADCIMLYSYARQEVFPKDVWIYRMMEELYNVPKKECEAYAAAHFAPYQGIAQQYLFTARNELSI